MIRTPWLRWIGVIALVAGICLLGYGLRGGSDAPQVVSEELLADVIRDWHNAYPAAERFVVLAAFNRDAVLDKTTGLVWERSPESKSVTYNEARSFCVGRAVGGEKGRRLPSPIELRSLVGPFRGLSEPHLPPHHPFRDVQATSYWAAVSEAEHGPYGKYVDNFLGNVLSLLNLNMFNFPVWCVRGPISTELS